MAHDGPSHRLVGRQREHDRAPRSPGNHANIARAFARRPTRQCRRSTLSEATGSYAKPMRRWELKKTLDRKAIQRVIDSRAYSLTFGDKFVEAYYVGDPTDEQAGREFDRSIQASGGLLGEAVATTRGEVARLWLNRSVLLRLAPVASSLLTSGTSRAAAFRWPTGGKLLKLGIPPRIPPSVPVSTIEDASTELCQEAGLHQVRTCQITVQRRFDSFDGGIKP